MGPAWRSIRWLPTEFGLSRTDNAVMEAVEQQGWEGRTVNYYFGQKVPPPSFLSFAWRTQVRRKETPDGFLGKHLELFNCKFAMEVISRSFDPRDMRSRQAVIIGHSLGALLAMCVPTDSFRGCRVAIDPPLQFLSGGVLRGLHEGQEWGDAKCLVILGSKAPHEFREHANALAEQHPDNFKLKVIQNANHHFFGRWVQKSIPNPKYSSHYSMEAWETAVAWIRSI